MLKNIFLLLVFILNVFTAYCQSEKKLAAAFIQSVAKNNFKLLTPYLYNASVAKSLFGKEFTKMPAAKQAETIKKYKAQLLNRWKEVVNTFRKNKIDFNKVQLKQVLSAPLEGNDYINSLLVTYEYNGIEWDDLFFIVNKKGASKYIIDLPSETKMFALNEDRRGVNLKGFQFEKDKNDPEIKQRLIEAMEVLKNFVASNDIQKIYGHMAYTGQEDNDNRWKRVVDPNKPEDIESAKRLLGKLKARLEKCDKIAYEDVRIEKESEGTWCVITATCDGKKSTYAFLKINGQYVLGDME